MSIAKALVAALLVVSYAGASLLPCESSRARTSVVAGKRAVAVAASSGHAGHGHGTAATDAGTHPDANHEMGHHPSAEDESMAESGHADCHEPPSLMPRCTCGCDEKSRARTPGGRLGPALLAAHIDGPAPTRAVHTTRSPGSLVDTPMLLPEPIPI